MKFSTSVQCLFARSFLIAISACVLLLPYCGLVGTAKAQDWNSVDFINHSVYQAVHADGSSAYSWIFPTRLIGVALNNNMDWLDPTAQYCTETGHPWDLGGQAEIFVQAVNLDGTEWDPHSSATFNDFGGTAYWLGQNYGNHSDHYQSTQENYTMLSLPYNYPDAVWYADELDRVGFHRPGSTLDEDALVRPGDLVELRARAGRSYKGKMNVNEDHDTDISCDFEIHILHKGYGLPEAENITLSALKDADNAFWFDSSRATGGEHYQSTLVTIQDVRLDTTDPDPWGVDSDLTLIDATGRTLDVHLGLNDSFSTLPAPEDYFNVTGILDQASYSGMGGYRLLAMNASAFEPVPEPGTLALLIAGLAGIMFRHVVRRSRNVGNRSVA